MILRKKPGRKRLGTGFRSTKAKSNYIAGAAHSKNYLKQKRKEKEAQNKLNDAIELGQSRKVARAYKQRERAGWKKDFEKAEKDEYWHQKKAGISKPKTKAKIKKSNYRPDRNKRKDTRETARIYKKLTRTNTW